MAGHRILLVDDEDYQLEFMRQTLERMGYDVETAASPEEALVRMAGESFSLIITDLIMPGMDGTEFCEEIRKTAPDAIVYAMSGHVELFPPERMDRVRFDAVLEKPLSIRDLQIALDDAFDRLESTEPAPD